MIALALALAATLSACGGEDDEPETSAASPSPTTAESPTEEASPTTAASPSTATEGDHPACEPAQRISDLDDEVTNTLTQELTKLLAAAGSGQPPSDEEFQAFLTQVQTVVEEKVPDLVAAYDDFAASLPPDLSDDAETLRDFTVTFTEQLAQLTPEELKNVDKLLQSPEAFEAVGATLALDKFTQKECDIVLAD